MKKAIDNFSTQAKIYQKFRPVYPPRLYNFILSQVRNRQKAWDCGTGNGQVALVLAEHFEQVAATDISENQINNAPRKENIQYEVVRAEQTNFQAATFDLITVAQAIHWFDFDAFFEEVYRVGKEGSVIAVFGYGLLKIESEIDEQIDHFYTNIIGPYWNIERRHIDKAYESVPFPFETIPVTETFFIETNWTVAQLEGYLNTWSSVQRFIKKEGYNPVDGFMENMKKIWTDDVEKPVRFPVFLKLGKITS
jgi:ubiquinone/menaquinone biosynthesis C-methylase UbiE